jgi:hypothetical protein
VKTATAAALRHMHRGYGACLSVRMPPTTSTKPITRLRLYRQK